MSRETDPVHATHIAVDEDEGERADVVLGRRIEGLSRRVARRMALEGRLRIDGRSARPSQRVHAGQRLELRISDAPPVPEDGPAEGATLGRGESPRVLAETPELVFVHKPPGMHSVALRPHEPDCLAAWVVARFPECQEASEDPREGGALHRLDHATSGVLAFARRREVWQEGREAFGEGDALKDYVAHSAAAWPPKLPEDGLSTWLDEGEPLEAVPGLLAPTTPSWRVRAALGPAQARGRMRVRMDGRRATTRLARLETQGPGSWIQVRLETGLRHQARVHLAWVGLPLVGDANYGGEAGPRLGLHAVRLDLLARFGEAAHALDLEGLQGWAPDDLRV